MDEYPLNENGYQNVAYLETSLEHRRVPGDG